MDPVTSSGPMDTLGLGLVTRHSTGDKGGTFVSYVEQVGPLSHLQYPPSRGCSVNPPYSEWGRVCGLGASVGVTVTTTTGVQPEGPDQVRPGRVVGGPPSVTSTGTLSGHPVYLCTISWTPSSSETGDF